MDSVIHLFNNWGLALVVQTLDSTTQRINHHPGDKYKGNQLCYPLNRDLSMQWIVLSTFLTTGAWPQLLKRWIGIYPVDSAIQLLINLCLVLRGISLSYPNRNTIQWLKFILLVYSFTSPSYYNPAWYLKLLTKHVCNLFFLSNMKHLWSGWYFLHQTLLFSWNQAGSLCLMEQHKRGEIHLVSSVGWCL